ncbi:type 1 glutamine amidotransferase family protein [Kribbella sancticallisti]|uniref:Type 1 glutamine amidotransferase family protein n=1 Tax=Kribbella sancticallisti TaxID=460087 RepID=A0ABN2D558_9ACTN
MNEITKATVHVAVYDTFSDWEIGFATAHVNGPLWQKNPGRYEVKTVGPSLEPITTAGGLRILPDLALADLRPEDSAMLVLAGNDLFPTEAYVPFTAKAREFLDAGVPVAAICGATGGLALAGLLDDREHTSNAAEFLNSLGYGGAHLYRDEPAVTDRDLITAAANAPVDFARAIFERLDVYEPHVLDSWYKLYGAKDPAGFYELMSA